VQLRVRRGVAWAGARRRRVPATRTGPGGRVAAVAGVRVLGAAWVRAPGQDSFEFGPALGPVVPVHRASPPGAPRPVGAWSESGERLHDPARCLAGLGFAAALPPRRQLPCPGLD